MAEDLGRADGFFGHSAPAPAGRARHRPGPARPAARPAAAPRSAPRSTVPRRRSGRAARASGPTANGTMVATSRKKATGSQAAPCRPRRTSRRISAPITGQAPDVANPRPSVQWLAAITAPPGVAVGGDGQRQAAPSPSRSRPLSGSSSSHNGAPLAMTRASRARLAWPVESSRTGTWASASSANAVIASASRGPFQKASARAERQLAVERQPLVGQRSLGTFDPASVGLQQAGDQPDQARLAAAVGAGEVQRLARAQLKVQSLEQQPAAANQRQSLRRAASGLTPGPQARACRRR